MFSHEIDNELKELTFSFFYKFSRFEFSLKENGFGKADRKKIASPDWKSFREKYENVYRLSDEATELLECPPKMQIMENSTLKFITESHEENDSDLRKIIRSVQRIRNNLFHGGKHGCGTEGEVQRNKYLLDKGSIILDQLAELDCGINFDYPGEY